MAVSPARQTSSPAGGEHERPAGESRPSRMLSIGVSDRPLMPVVDMPDPGWDLGRTLYRQCRRLLHRQPGGGLAARGLQRFRTAAGTPRQGVPQHRPDPAAPSADPTDRS